MSQVIVISPDELQRLIVKAVNDALPCIPETGGKRLLSGKDVEEEYGISKRCLEQWRSLGIGPTYTNVGRKVFYERDKIEEYITGGRVAGARN